MYVRARGGSRITRNLGSRLHGTVTRRSSRPPPCSPPPPPTHKHYGRRDYISGDSLYPGELRRLYGCSLLPEPGSSRSRPGEVAQQHVSAMVSAWDMYSMYSWECAPVAQNFRTQHGLWRKISGARYARGISGACVNRVGISGWGCERIGRNLCYSTDL